MIVNTLQGNWKIYPFSSQWTKCRISDGTKETNKKKPIRKMWNETNLLWKDKLVFQFVSSSQSAQVLPLYIYIISLQFHFIYLIVAQNFARDKNKIKQSSKSSNRKFKNEIFYLTSPAASRYECKSSISSHFRDTMKCRERANSRHAFYSVFFF